MDTTNEIDQAILYALLKGIHYNCFTLSHRYESIFLLPTRNMFDLFDYYSKQVQCTDAAESRSGVE